MSEQTSTSARAVTVDELCEHLSALRRPDGDALCRFARLFFAKVPRQLLEERGTAQLAALTLGAWEFLRGARPDQVNVQVVDPEDEGWSAPVTVIRAEVGDRPFIVDTVREYLAAEGLHIHQYAYPVIPVRRGPAGEIVAVGDEAGEGASLEALTHCEVARVTDPAQRTAVAEGIRQRLADVVDATSDFPAMTRVLEHEARVVEEYAARFPDRAAEFAEEAAFLRWLGLGNFVFLGFREYAIEGEGDAASVAVRDGSGLGILRDASTSSYAAPVRVSAMAAGLRERLLGGPTLMVAKSNAESTVHRRARMDYVGVKVLDEAGRVRGERRFLGLFTSQAYGSTVADVPLLRGKLDRLLAASGSRPGGHDYKEIVSIVDALPKDELFEATEEELRAQVQASLAALFTEGVRVVVRANPVRDEAAVLVILPGGRFSAEVRRAIGQLLADRLGGEVVNHYLRMAAGDQARIHYYLTTAPGAALPDPRELEREVAGLLRSWQELLGDALRGAGVEDAEAEALTATYGAAFSPEYRAANIPQTALHDVLHLEALRRRGEAVALQLRQPLPGEPAPQGSSILKLYLSGERLVLSDFMPILEDARLRVLEVDTFQVRAAGAPDRMIYSFAVQTREGTPIPDDVTPLLAESLLAVRAGDAVEDPFNGLVLAAGLRWREADLLRAYAEYAFQVGAIPSRIAVARALAAYPAVTRGLVQLFHARFAAEGGDEAPARASLADEMEKVSSLADDRALRRLLALIGGTVRTNYFRGGGADPTARSGGVPYMSFKVRSADVDELKKTRLLYEVFVHSSRMEGVHLRGAPVARGGIRWSDRPDDFRTEILGLVTTQVIKNAVIVPSGSKGGFITRRRLADRDAMGEEAKEQYRTLMRGLLDITDNLVGGSVVPPQGVVRHDGDDPYLVVAADKGTAHLSDVANAVSAEYGFWMGDAFASGGSNGYDHKKEGITARGGWECVKRHFREMGKDIQKEPFTVAGVGDMSGDVFGNGMLLSKQIRLLAAFDHRHIFIDPTPDPAVSFEERQRIFDLPRSSWEDYDRSKLSPGALIVPRGSKEVELTPEARAALGLGDEVATLDGEALIRAVLTAPVELLWNGGIGTYVKDREETHAEVGDPTNDPVRVDADVLRCKVIGEGGNLGLTQRARITFNLRGGRLNTDALDNSAGVDMSDHEVNLKILLNGLVVDGSLSEEQRNETLRVMTDQVSELVLRDNVSQSLAVSLDQRRSREALDDFAALIAAQERERLLNREAEGIPTPDEIAERRAEKIGLTRPTLSVLLAHAKMAAKMQLLDSTVPDDPATESYLVNYFPPLAVETAGLDRLRSHRLRREIVTTQMVNDLVDLMGSSFLHRTSRDTGHSIPEVVRAWLVASRISGTPEVRADLAGAEGRYDVEVVYGWLLGLGQVLETTTHWILANVAPGAATDALIEDARSALSALRGNFAKVVSGEDRALFLTQLGAMQDLGVERGLAERLITLRFLPQLLEIVEVSRRGQTDELRAAKAFYAVSEHFATARLRQAVQMAAGRDPWERRFAQALGDDVQRAQRALVTGLLARAGDGAPAGALERLEAANPRGVRAYRDLLAELRVGNCPLSAYALAVHQLREVAGAAVAGD
ncbi:NAD-glutamate dehydrogenase [Longimicrobium sp.]|jgi:glutamate dehydrogenase|uniref:NAD-glutamate dehydrogenase n=1 Tax=Longimicrobium sp. TaxID=2029185 RepID=UPI002ED8B4B3